MLLISELCFWCTLFFHPQIFKKIGKECRYGLGLAWSNRHGFSDLWSLVYVWVVHTVHGRTPPHRFKKEKVAGI